VTNGIDDVLGELNANAVLTSGVSTGDGGEQKDHGPGFSAAPILAPIFHTLSCFAGDMDLV